jgi:hypothetical protein
MMGQAWRVMNELDNEDDLISSSSSALSNSFITLQAYPTIASIATIESSTFKPTSNRCKWSNFIAKHLQVHWTIT